MYWSSSCLKLFLAALIIVFCISLSGFCFAQTAYFPWAPIIPYSYLPTFPLYNSYVPWLSPVQAFMPPVPFSSPIAPVPSLSLPRFGNATVITIPAATNTISSATAPLGTLSLTPSTLVFLILLFTLH